MGHQVTRYRVSHIFTFDHPDSMEVKLRDGCNFLTVPMNLSERNFGDGRELHFEETLDVPVVS